MWNRTQVNCINTSDLYTKGQCRRSPVIRAYGLNEMPFTLRCRAVMHNHVMYDNYNGSLLDGKKRMNVQ